MKKKVIRTRQRGDKWYYSFDAGKVSGKRKVIEKGGFATEEEAMQAGMEAYVSWKHGNIGIVSERTTLKDFLHAWLENVIKPNASVNTYLSYKGAINGICQAMGKTELQALRPRDIDEWMRGMAAAGKSHATISHSRKVLSSAMKYAIYPGELIQSNPCTAVRVPKGAPKHVISRTVISREQIKAMLAKFPPGHKYRIPILLAYHTGMRIGEVLGLEWDDINLEAASVSVRQQMQADASKGNALYFTQPKTESSVRSLYFDASLLAELRRWKSEQSATRMEKGTAYQNVYEGGDHLVFTLPQSEPAPKGAVLKHLVCTDGYGVPVRYASFEYAMRSFGVNSHSLRHTHTTELAEGGASPINIASRLGHADANMVNSVYAHDTENMKRETVRIMERMCTQHG